MKAFVKEIAFYNKMIGKKNAVIPLNNSINIFFEQIIKR